VAGLTGVTALTGGGFHTCAAVASGAISCWGSNDSGQLGDGTEADHAMPGAVPGAHL